MLAQVLLGAATLTSAAASTAPPRARRPHILHVIIDDFGWANTNYHRAVPTPEVVTPHMDGLVKEGVMMMRHYVHPECTPTRVSFQTG
jgi:arylsulfatase B